VLKSVRGFFIMVLNFDRGRDGLRVQPSGWQLRKGRAEAGALNY